jgi:hypothetical protein
LLVFNSPLNTSQITKNMASPIATGSADATEFFALTSLERQAQYLLIKLSAAENAYNTANPNTPSTRVAVQPNYDSNAVVSQLVLTLSDAAISGKLVDGVQAFLP